jgi:RNA recognition motif-containing protein
MEDKDANRAITELNGTDFGGRRLKVEEAHGRLTLQLPLSTRRLAENHTGTCTQNVAQQDWNP